MLVRIRSTGDVISTSEFVAMNSETSFPLDITPEIMNEFGADPVYPGPQPVLKENQYSEYVGVEEIDGIWFTKYIAVDYTPEQLAQQLAEWRQSATCSPFQGRMALSDAGLLSQTQAIIDNPSTDEKMKIAWEYAVIWERMSPMTLNLIPALGITDTQADDLFKAAQKIVA